MRGQLTIQPNATGPALNPPPVLRLQDSGNSLQLPLNNLDGVTILPLLEALTNAQDDRQASFESSLGFIGDELVSVAKQGTTLRVTEDDPWYFGVSKLVW
jgi:hypothetical protein